MIGLAMAGAASFTIYTRTKEFFRDHHLIDHSKLLGCAAVGGIGGAMAGALISFGSAREFCRPVPILPLFLF
jgi:solute carrier family 25 carnitine/acylcarnitine transporter 20/29